MSDRVLIIGGTGRIGSSIAQDLAGHTDAQIVVTGRQTPSSPIPYTFFPLDLAERDRLKEAIQGCRLVIHCAGPFHYRDGRVLATCIECGVDYLDVSDCRSFAEKAIEYSDRAAAAGVTAILHTGVFPGISNSMARLGVEQLDKPEAIYLYYVVAGSGGAGVTVMRTTFLGLQKPFPVWLNGQWQTVQPYSDRTVVEFPQPYGKTGVYWFEVAETYTLARTFPVHTVVTKFGSVPDFYNYLTALTARYLNPMLQDGDTIEYLARLSKNMTRISDRFSGIGIALRVEVSGIKQEKPTRYVLSFSHENTATATGNGTGSIAEFILNGQLHRPGVWAIEQVVPTERFQQAMASRGNTIHQKELKTESMN